VIAAAGRSTRMGEPKQLLPWGSTTVLAAVVANLAAAGAAPVVCVVGHRGAEMAALLAGSPACIVKNPDYLSGEMLSSYQAGIGHLSAGTLAAFGQVAPLLGALLALGDQPHIPASVIAQVIAQARRTPDALVIPSFHMRRGHPFYLPAALWPELLALPPGDTLRTLVRRHEAAIIYVALDTDAILRDIDTPADYRELSAPSA
jgi:molybdenum cofactor cytidylyltransferase